MIDRIQAYIASWEGRGYDSGIPDEAPYELERMGIVPSWKMVCKAILKNDIKCTSLGFSRPQCAMYMELKRIELLRKKKIKCGRLQYSLFGGENERI